MRAALAIVGFGVGLGCGPPAVYVCMDDAQCSRENTQGMCEAGGYCSFPDETCPSGRRFGAHSPDEIAQQCVRDDDDGGTSTSVLPDTDTGTTEADDTSSSDGGGETLALTSGATTTTDGTTGAFDGSGGSSTGASLDPDLVLWLTFDDPDDPYADASAYARTVVCNAGDAACPEIATRGTFSGVSVFDGVDDVLEIPHDPDLETDSGLTVALFVRNDMLSALPIRTVIARPYGVATENSWELFFRDQDADGSNDLVFEIADSDGQQQLIVPPLVAKGEWQHVAAVWSPGSVSLYLDGELQATAAAADMLFDDASVRVGADLDTAVIAHHFAGAIADVRVYRRALDEAEIAALP